MSDPTRLLSDSVAERGLDLAGVAVWVLDATGATTSSNQHLRALVGRSDVAPAHARDVNLFSLAGTPLPRAEHPFERVSATGEPATLTAALDRTGKRVLHWAASPLAEAGESLTHVLIAVTDVTAQVHAERARRIATEHLRLALDHAPLILWTTDATGTVTLSEGAGLAGLGVAPGELVGRNVFDLYASDPLVLGHIGRALGGESFSHESKIGELILDTWTGPLRDDDGLVVGVIGVSTDITTRSALQAQSIQADRIHALGTLAASIAHEVNNPLTYALLSSELASQLLTRASQASLAQAARDEALAAMPEPLARVRDGLDRIRVITANMRSFSRPEEALVLLDLPSAAKQTLQLVSKDIGLRAELVLDLEPVPSVFCSEARIGQVVLNLLMNALLSTPSNEPGHVVFLETRAEETSVVFVVEDTGPGIPEPLRARVFEPFYTTRPVGEGTGLGLFVCRNIVRGYGGTITITTGRRGGARFEVRLPTASPTSSRLPPADPGVPSDQARPARILVIDDDANVRRSFVRTLEAVGHSVVEACSGEEGLARLLADETFDLCFCDLMMSGVTGGDVYRRAVSKRSDLATRIVIMTGGAFTAETRAFVESHGRQCVDKPFNIIRESAIRLAALPPS